jgi:hypothetical protein
MKSCCWWLLTLLCACGPAGEGRFVVRMSGGERVERGFAPSLLRDGWAVTFEKYLVSSGALALTREQTVLRRPDVWLVDLQKGARETTTWAELPAGRWNVSFSVLPPDEATQLLDVSEADAAEMRANGWATLVEGTATRTGVGSFPFRVGLPLAHRYTNCTNGLDGTLGLVLADGATETLELTTHDDNQLNDRLGTHRDVQLRFDAWTRDVPATGRITLDSLRGQDLLDLRARDGATLRDDDGTPVVYDPGSYAVRTLDAFVAQSLTDQAHLNGGGLCTVTRLSP